MNLFGQQRNNNLHQQEGFIQEHENKKNSYQSGKIDKSKTMGIIILILLVSMFLSLIF